MTSTPYWVAGSAQRSEDILPVTFPYDSSVVGTTSWATPEHVERAVEAAAAVAREFAAAPAHRRAGALDLVSRRIAERADEIAALITSENGKPMKWSRGEVARAVSTFRWGAEEARRWSGSLQRLDTDPNGEGRLGVVRRISRGPVLAITPFNFPLNLVAHKVAPALAIGAPVVIKPAPSTPLTTLLLGEILAEAGLPEGSWSVLPVPNERAGALVDDPRLPVVSFTGSGPVGWSLLDRVPRKHVTLELGGNAAVIVCADTTGAELDRAAARIATFAMYQAGQSCISVQRVFADSAVYDELAAKVLSATEALVVGDPRDEKTDVGPVIDEKAAERIVSWVGDAVSSGARLLCGGTREGATVAPTVLVDVADDASVSCEEVFGPVVTLAAVDSVDEAFARVNSSRFGLQAGVFTRDLGIAFRAAAELEVGGVIIGDVPSFRADQMPYGGVKESGIGREGVAAAMTDLSYERVTVLTGIPL